MIEFFFSHDYFYLYVNLIIAQTGLQGPVLYKGDKRVNVAAEAPTLFDFASHRPT